MRRIILFLVFLVFLFYQFFLKKIKNNDEIVYINNDIIDDSLQWDINQNNSYTSKTQSNNIKNTKIKKESHPEFSSGSL